MKPLLTRIDEELAVCVDPYRRAELLGEQGCYFARLGRFEDCRKTIEVLRADFKSTANPASLAWVMVVEGLQSYFASLSATAIDRVWRSYESGRALGIDSLREFGAAWLAHLEFERSSFSDAAKLIQRVDLCHPSGLELARLRASMVLGDVTLFTGDRASSQHWYSVAHRCAVSLGDQAAIGALMYNRAAFGVASLRADLAARGILPDAALITFAEMELASARAFERAIGANVLGHLVDLCEGRVRVLRGDFAGALDRFQEALPAVEQVEKRPNRSHISGEIMYCEFRLGRVENATRMAVQLLAEDHSMLDVDDRVVLARQLVEVFGMSGDSRRENSATEMLSAAVDAYGAVIACIRREFAEFYLPIKA